MMDRARKKNKHEEFEQWYEAQQAAEPYYSIKHEALKYCMNDTEILAKAVQHFRWNVLELSNGMCDPIVGESITLASLIAHIYRSEFMKPKSIGILPRLGYGVEGRKQSLLALKYLEYLNGIRVAKGQSQLLHAKNNRHGEIKIAGYKVDAVASDGSVAYEICGCFIHAHHCKYGQKRKIHPLYHIPMAMWPASPIFVMP